MAGLNNIDFIRNLINAGNDAFSNLFEVDFAFQGGRSINKVRAVDVTIPEIGNNAITLPYQNSDYVIVTPGHKLDRHITIVMRLDSNYNLLKELYDLLGTDPSGNDFDQHDNSKIFTTTVKVYPDLNSEPSAVYTFKKCKLEAVPGITYSYSNPSALRTGNLKIAFVDMETSLLQK